jgi:hypothetical protein
VLIAPFLGIYLAVSKACVPDILARLATNGCNARVSILDKPKITDSMSIRFLFPVQKSWLDGHRTVSCMIANPTANITSSVLSP